MQISTRTTDGTAIVTGGHMAEMVRRYHTDMLPWVSYSLWEVFNFVKAIPFRPDPPLEETLMRPYYTMRSMGWGGDCDDKSICLASYCECVGIPWRFVAVRRSDKEFLHHVFCECYIDNRWVHADPTYIFNTLGRQREPYAEYHIIGGSHDGPKQPDTHLA